jgi:hypothetical protein
VTGPNPVERVAGLLVEAGYLRHHEVLRIASIEFQFLATFTAPRSLDLVVLLDTVTETETRLQQKLLGLSNALDVVASRRSITAILVGPPPSRPTHDVLLRTGRVLVVGTPVGENAVDEIRDAIAILLPLQLPAVTDTTARSWEDLRDALIAGPAGQEISRVLDAAVLGTSEVTNQLRIWLSEPFAEQLP